MVSEWRIGATLPSGRSMGSRECQHGQGFRWRGEGVSMRKCFAVMGVVVMGGALLAGCDASGDPDGLASPEPTKDAGIDKVTIKLDAPTITLDPKVPGPRWKPVIVNDSGKDLKDAVLKITIDRPGKGVPAVTVGQPGELTDQDCVVDDDGEDVGAEVDKECAAHLKEEWGFPLDDAGDRSGFSGKCAKRVKPGKTDYLLEFGTRGLHGPEDLSKIRHYPRLRIHAKLFTAAGIVDTATEDLDVKVPKAFERVSFRGVPKEIPSDRTRPHSLHWGFTVTNDTGHDLDGAVIDVDVNGRDLVNIATKHKGCDYPADSGGERTEMKCTKVDIAAGTSLTVDMWASAVKDSGELKANCHEFAHLCGHSRLEVTVQGADRDDVFASGATLTRVKMV
ncbi:MAG TPA: hypothetical protein VE172_11905 [Stackebrandtia sp.]|jgi:hypothetical protein|uniref:hypothetical protein n=1 Tax=Stackebrandtia sp. TaxID=2023065 RepID=UPI002D34E0E8|nr:hypothetical protein [Stackebrandtia sp.]HZE39503.1 hypothetical protein [Stackebrandtia sp.]